MARIRAKVELNSIDVEALLADPQYVDDPLYQALEATHLQMLDQARQLDRIARISDGFQSVARTENADLVDRLDRHIRKLEKIARISDRYQSMLQQLNQRLEFESTHDALTGLANRRHAAERLEKYAARGQRLFLAIADIDHFKQINDRHGHYCGDQALILIAKAMQAEPSLCDFVARWGGEEFLLVWHGDGAARVTALAEAMRLRVQQIKYPSEEAAVPLTISIGLVAGITQGVDRALSQADLALYKAKASGRNRVSVGRSEAPEYRHD